jgi:hypothetical protein
MTIAFMMPWKLLSDTVKRTGKSSRNESLLNCLMLREKGTLTGWDNAEKGCTHELH